MGKRYLHCLCVMAMLCLSAPSFALKVKDGSEIQPDNAYPRVKINTNLGEFILELDRFKAPITVNNFLRYVALRSYEDTIFHRVVPDFVVQGGGYTVDYKSKPSLGKIFNESGNGLKNTYYSIAMARETDPHSATRQFFINLKDNESLDPGRNWGYTVFGSVVEGFEVIDAMGEVETEYSINFGQPDVPIEPIILQKAEILPPQF
jgi:peptidyl-prolyl cis-trans isomerase A (cyclophilin A)